jgi:hypothetical protein
MMLPLRLGCRKTARTTTIAKAGPEMAARLHDLHQKPLRSVGGAPCATTSRLQTSKADQIASAAGMAHAFSSRFSSFRKRQSVPSAMSWLGADVIMPTSFMRSA